MGQSNGPPPLGRHLVFAKADATLHFGERAFPLFSNRWGGGAMRCGIRPCVPMAQTRMDASMSTDPITPISA